MALCLRALAAFAESNKGLVPSTDMVAHNHLISVLGGLDALSSGLRGHWAHMYTCRQNTLIHKIKLNKYF